MKQQTKFLLASVFLIPSAFSTTSVTYCYCIPPSDLPVLEQPECTAACGLAAKKQTRTRARSFPPKHIKLPHKNMCHRTSASYRSDFCGAFISSFCFPGQLSLSDAQVAQTASRQKASRHGERPRSSSISSLRRQAQGISLGMTWAPSHCSHCCFRQASTTGRSKMHIFVRYAIVMDCLRSRKLEGR